MYIQIGETKYENIKRVKLTDRGNIYYTGASIPKLDEITGSIGLYANNGFHLRDDDPSSFRRIGLEKGAIQLIVEELPEPRAIPDERLYPDEIETAIEEGVSSI